MALEATFRRLSLALHKLHEAVTALQVTVGDTPPDDESVLGDAMENAVFDMMGTLHEIGQAALEAQKSVGHPADMSGARHALTRCQEHFHRVEQQFASDLASYKSLNELARLGEERRRWIPWASAVQQGIEQCRGPMEQTSTALSACWQELAEHLGALSISMKATNVGQQITVSKPKVKDWKSEGVG
jgi:hypothetical protein